MKIGILIGPEGGFEPYEVEEAQAAGWQVLSLGKRILRTETAGMAVMAHLMLTLDP
jgi:16S rRNA (uracil1498-N3)-methyltransferase